MHEKDQQTLDDLTLAIAKHNRAIADTILGAEKSLALASEQLRLAEASLALLKKHIVNVVVNHRD